MSTPKDQQLDRALDAERAVLGGILVDAERLNDAEEFLVESDFHRLAHRTVYRTMLDLHAQGRGIDLVTVVQALTPAELADVDVAYLSALIDGVPSSMNVGHYARVAHEHATVRALERHARRIIVDAESGEFGAEQLIEQAEGLIYGLRDRTMTTDIIAPERRASAAFAQMEALTSGRGVMGVPTGLTDLDARLRGMHAGNLLVIGARPSVGKSGLALTIAVNAAAASGKPSLFVSLEMSHDELNLRELTMRARVDGWKLSRGYLSEVEQQRLGAAVSELGDGGVHIVDAPGLTIGRIRALARRAHAKHGLGVVIVDYLQLIASESARGAHDENRTQEVGAQSRALKGLARELGLPIVLLSQLSRAVEARSDKRPMLSDLRESGAIEQDADVVLFLYRPHVYDTSADPTHVEIIISKQRNGPVGTVHATFLAEYTKFEDRTERAS